MRFCPKLWLYQGKALTLILVAFVAVCAISVLPTEAANGYYIADGATLRHVDGDPEKAAVDGWQYWVYLKGSDTSQLRNRWGIVEKKTAAGAAAELAADQRFEKKFESFCSCDFGAQTYFNAVGPIASIHTITYRAVADAASELLGQADSIRETVTMARALAGNEEPSERGHTLKGFLDSLKDALERVSGVRETVQSASIPADILAGELRDINGELMRERQALPTLGAALASQYARPPSTGVGEPFRINMLYGSDKNSKTVSVLMTLSRSGSAVSYSLDLPIVDDFGHTHEGPFSLLLDFDMNSSVAILSAYRFGSCTYELLFDEYDHPIDVADSESSRTLLSNINQFFSRNSIDTRLSIRSARYAPECPK